jgi:hypothetical protein
MLSACSLKLASRTPCNTPDPSYHHLRQRFVPDVPLTRLNGASLSKWPSAVMISGVVADGKLNYTDLAGDFFFHRTAQLIPVNFSRSGSHFDRLGSAIRSRA